MRLVALLSWYAEQPEWLRETVLSLRHVGADAIVAVDGAYALFPGAQARSDREQRIAIMDAAEEAGIACTVHVPSSPWRGNEVQKRDFLFRLAEPHATAEDWYLVIDGDEVVLTAPDDLRETLTAAPCDSATACLLDGPVRDTESTLWHEGFPAVSHGRSVDPHRCFFRAVRGLSVVGRHHDYITPDGRNLWGDSTPADEPTVNLPELVIDHRRPEREQIRRHSSLNYYAERDAAGIERHWSLC